MIHGNSTLVVEHYPLPFHTDNDNVTWMYNIHLHPLAHTTSVAYL
jgi:hypothetical protein